MVQNRAVRPNINPHRTRHLGLTDHLAGAAGQRKDHSQARNSHIDFLGSKRLIDASTVCKLVEFNVKPQLFKIPLIVALTR